MANSEQDQTECRLGIFFRPRRARTLASPKLLVATYGFLNVVDGMLFMYYVGIMTTFEAHFQLKSEALGMVMSIGELVPIFAAVIFGYFCGAGDRPRWIAFCAMLTSTGTFIAALPFFIFGAPSDDVFQNINEDNQQNTSAGLHLCMPLRNESVFGASLSANASDKNCETFNAHEHSNVVIMIYLTGYTMFNCGAVILYVVGTPYMDDNVTQKNSPLYMAILCSLRTTGPMMGFLLSYFSLSLYVNPHQSDIDSEDPRWLGAWWLGYVVMSSLAAIGAFLIAQFPKRLPSNNLTPAMKMELLQPGISRKEAKEATKEKTVFVAPCKIFNSIKGFFQAMKPLLKNHLYLLRMISEVFTLFALESYLMYLPKYLEHQFNVPASDASAWTGFGLIGPIVIGDLLVGFYIQRYNPSGHKLAVILAVTKVLYTAGVFGLMLIQCDTAYVTGLHDTTPDLSSCNANCDCLALPFQPVCVDESRNFLSACHAGCTSVDTSNDVNVYQNCSCADNGIAIAHMCPGICSNFVPYLMLTTLAHFMISVDVVAGLLFIFRCIPTEQKTLAMGVACMITSILTFVPCPIVSAAIIDTTCALWSVTCGENGACLLYDIDKFRYLLHGFPFALLIIACVWDVLFCIKAKNLDLYGEEDIEPVENADMPDTKL